LADALAFPVEEIPDANSVFMRAHKAYFRDGQLEPGVFTSKEGPGMSVDWDKYSSKEETQRRAKSPSDNAVISLSVRGIRAIDALDVKHLPEADNQAHSEVDLPDKREELTEIRLLLRRLALIVIPLADSSIG
jgi:hypothetical protein